VLRLFTTLYPEKNTARMAEYQECLRRNLEAAIIQEVCILSENAQAHLPAHPKLRVRKVTRRPRYDELFAWVNELAGATDFSVLANTDVWFDDGLRQIEAVNWSRRTVLAVSRWDVLENGKNRLFEYGDSQDCWIVRGTIQGVQGNFPIGVYDCDNKIAWEFAQAGYIVVNPALSLRTYHLHLCGYRSYKEAPAPDYGIRPPFRYEEPDNLWGPCRALRLRRQLRLPYVPWRMTAKRFWRYSIPALGRRAWNKALRELGKS